MRVKIAVKNGRLNKIFNKEDIMRIDYVEKLSVLEIEKVALYNKNKITEEEVLEVIKLHGIGYNPNVILIDKEQFENVFGN